nr:DEAD/DEAH box helicase [Herbaspirillum sp. C7C8]
MPWANALGLVRELSPFQRPFGFRLIAKDGARAEIQRFQSEFKKARELSPTSVPPEFSAEQIEKALLECGFSKRRLKPYQIRDIQRLLQLPHGANFSVPGAGKTTVTFALTLLENQRAPFVLVIAPRNAFKAWDEVITDNISDDCHEWPSEPLWRLDGDILLIKKELNSGRRRFIISYDKAIRVTDVLEGFLITNPTHLILDESHRIKSAISQRKIATLRLAPFAKRRDILSGTPSPHSVADLVPQLDFLWPGTGLSKKVLESASPSEAMRTLYVRTTKRDLKLPPRKIVFKRVPMSDSQLAFYGLLRSEFLRKYGAAQLNGSFDLFRARNNALRLLQIATNPVLAAKGIEDFIPEDDNASDIVKAVLREGNSPKILKACDLARDLSRDGHKVVIWTVFIDTIRRIRDELADLSPVELHGGIPTGSAEDPQTREYAIERFHNDPNCRVAIANAAACGEGISLHRICHHAIYVDRNYNAAHYLQSIDRIHRLGLPEGTNTYIHVLQSVVPAGLGSIDHSVSRRLASKIRAMQAILEDQDLHEIALDEEEAEVPIDASITLEDVKDIIEQLISGSIPEGDDAA